MGMLTHVEGSPNGPLSASAAIARAYIDGLRSRNPDTDVRTIRVFDKDAVPTFGEVESAAKIAIVTGQTPSPEGIAAWEGINTYVQAFDQSDVIVLSSPIWNFHVPWRLKLFFDVIVQPGMTFGFDENFQPFGMMRDRPVRMFLTSSSTGADSPANFQLPWLRQIWSMMGLADVDAMTVPLLPTPDSPYEDQVTQAAERAYERGAAGI